MLDEPEQAALRRALDTFEAVVSSALLVVESVRACARYGDERAVRARNGLAAVSLVPLDDAVLLRAAMLEPATLRSLDAIHLATALSLGDDVHALFAYDPRLTEAATAAGLTVLAPS